MESSRVRYFNTWVQLAVYYYRVVYTEDGHFTRRQHDYQVPKDVIQVKASQQNAFKDVVQAAQSRKVDEDEDEQIAFRHLLRQFFLTLICHVVGSMPFRPPILSFCAVLSRTVHLAKVAKGDRIEAKGVWKEPGNFSSHLSALTWTAQVLLFDYACFQEQGDEDQIPVFLREICQKERYEAPDYIWDNLNRSMPRILWHKTHVMPHRDIFTEVLHDNSMATGRAAISGLQQLQQDELIDPQLLNDALNDSTTPSRTSTLQIAPKPIVYNKSKKRVRIEGSDDEDTPAAKKKVDLGAAIIALTSEMAIARQSKSEQSRAVELLETAYGKRLDMMVFIQGCTFFED
jgi:hypothetical protein